MLVEGNVIVGIWYLHLSMCGNGLRSLVQKLLCTKECYVMNDGVLTRKRMIGIWQWYGTMEYQNPQHSP